MKLDASILAFLRIISTLFQTRLQNDQNAMRRLRAPFRYRKDISDR